MRGKMQCTCQDKLKPLFHLTWTLTHRRSGPVMCTVPSDPHSLSHLLLTKSREEEFYFKINII